MRADLAEAYQDYALCTKVYHCLPSELNEENAADVDLHWQMYQEELKHEEAKRKAAQS
jgi:hypothetical protein